MKNNKTIVIVVLIVLAIFAFSFWRGKLVQGPSTPDITADTTADIQADIQGIDIGDLNGDFEQMDKDINTL